MSASEVLTIIENELTRLEIKDKWGVPCIGNEAYGALAKHYGELLDMVETDFKSGKLSLLEYRDVMVRLIQDYGRVRFRNTIERKLVAIREAV